MASSSGVPWNHLPGSHVIHEVAGFLQCYINTKPYDITHYSSFHFFHDPDKTPMLYPEYCPNVRGLQVLPPV